MDKSVVNKGGHPFALDDAGNIPIIDEEDFSHTSHISNTSLALPSSVNTGIMDIDREPEQEQSVRRHVRQNEVCETIDASRCFIDDESCTKDEAKPSVQETEEPGRTLNSADCKCWSQSEKNNPEQRRDVADIDNKNVNLIADESSTQSILDNPANYVTHKLSFPVANKNKDKESLYDAESESQLSVSQISSSEAYLASDFPDVKVKNKTKKQKTHKLGKDGRDSDSSVSSKRKGSSSKTRIKSKFTPGSLEYIEQRLCGRLFSGWVGERRWVESLRAYRDVIEVDEWEVDMNQQLKAIINSIPGVYEGTKWINLSPPGESLCYCLWVLLAAPPVPGHYWYTVTGIQLEPLFGLRILVKEIRRIHPHDGEEAAVRQKRQKQFLMSDTGNELQSLGEQLQEWVEQARRLKFSTVWCVITSAINIKNIKETIRFLVILVMTLVIGFVSFVKESHNLGLQFIREAGIFFHHITPFLQTVLSFIEKLIGGMYLLIAMVYRDWRRPSVPPPPYPLRNQPLGPGRSPGAALPPSEQRVLKYVPPQQWVFKNQNNESSPS